MSYRHQITKFSGAAERFQVDRSSGVDMQVRSTIYCYHHNQSLQIREPRGWIYQKYVQITHAIYSTFTISPGALEIAALALLH